MRTDPRDRQRGHGARDTGRVSARPGRARAVQGRDRFSAVIVLMVTIATTGLSIYDLHLLVELLGP
jgi:hypothetical protein